MAMNDFFLHVYGIHACICMYVTTYVLVHMCVAVRG